VEPGGVTLAGALAGGLCEPCRSTSGRRLPSDLLQDLQEPFAGALAGALSDLASEPLQEASVISAGALQELLQEPQEVFAGALAGSLAEALAGNGRRHTLHPQDLW
jgi:hypothetical protein